VEAESGAVIRAQAPASRSALVAWILMSHDPAVPDNLDYEWLGWLVEHPEKWTEEDLAGARFMLANQKSAVEAMHPKDPNGRRAAQEVVDLLEAAIQKYVEPRP
jgi:hypothetical protein